MPLICNEAYVTLVTSDSYVAGAGVLARSLKSTGTNRSIWCLAASKQLSSNSLDILKSIFDGISEVDCIDSGDQINLALLGRPELGPTFTKLHLWKLTQFKKVVFLDADTLVLKNIDDLFEREEFSACADVGWPDCFNSGVFVAVPNGETYRKLLQHADKEGSFDGGDQGLLNSFFSDWSVGPSSKRIPFTYNLTINASYSYAPAFSRFKNDVKVVHFIGAQKPWTYYRLSDGSIVPRGNGSDNVNLEYIQIWWSIFDKISKSIQDNNSLSFAPSGSIMNRSNDEVIKFYPSSTSSSSSSISGAMNTSGLNQTYCDSSSQFNYDPESDFATYRVKWNADVERYFHSDTLNKTKLSTSTTSASSSSPTTNDSNQQFLVKNLRHQSHASSSNKSYRILGGCGDDKDDNDGCYYYDD